MLPRSSTTLCLDVAAQNGEPIRPEQGFPIRLLLPGYEGNTSMYPYGMPANRWADDVEDLIAAGVDRVVKQARGAP